MSLKRRAETLNRKVCCREAGEDGFCPMHSKAYRNILDKFRVWEPCFERVLEAIFRGDSEKFINWSMG